MEQTARFFRKPSCVGDLTDETPIIRPSHFEVTKVIELSGRRYSLFSRNLLTDAPFIAANVEWMGCDTQSGLQRCLLICCPDYQDGILINSEGYDYARYAAYLRDTSRLNLKDIPTERYSQRAKADRSGQER